MSDLEYNGVVAYDLMMSFEKILIKEKPTYSEVMVACLALAVISADKMKMSKDLFMANCEIVYEKDKIQQVKGMQ
jgi:hypothetical protein